jgi:phosphoribosylformylglycinamidine cyclo-ligase
MYHVFNMGIGMVILCSPDNAEKVTGQLPEARVIGEVVKAKGKERVIIE